MLRLAVLRLGLEVVLDLGLGVVLGLSLCRFGGGYARQLVSKFFFGSGLASGVGCCIFFDIVIGWPPPVLLQNAAINSDTFSASGGWVHRVMPSQRVRICTFSACRASMHRVRIQDS